MERKTVLVIADLGGCPPHMFYKSAAEKYNLVSYIPRPFAITASHAALIEKYSVAVIKDKDYFQSLADFEHPDSIYWAHEDHDKPEEEVVEQIVKVAEMFGADAITTNNELFIAPMAKACERLGLRGAGVQAAENARDKNKMRDAFNKAGVKSIKNKRVTTLEDFRAALEEIGTPLILKPTYLASSIGVTLITDIETAESEFNRVNDYLKSINVPKAVTFEAPFIAEEFLQGEYGDWYQTGGYSDYISIEGIMADGEYFPIAIHDKTPQIGFTETSHITPSILDEEAKKKIVEAAKKANEGLGLENCATHTEIKLMKNREPGLIESAARFAGWNMIPNIKKVFGVDMAQLLLDVLCFGKDADLPNGLLDQEPCYLADCHLYPEHFKQNGQIPETAEDLVIEAIDIPDGLLKGDTEIVSFEAAAPGTSVDLTLFEAFNSIAAFELKGSNSQDVADSIRHIQQHAKLTAKYVLPV
ncbi:MULTISPECIES: alanine--anticapsin ligase [Bacillus]|uniref:alanine--anticapsin ligase n=1 Tax=Bacillus TaxID=1386 RepID=UPI00057BEF4C|nr:MULTISPECIES: alanine--anticapsin ligase [Bacillus]PJZ01491.1 ATP-grasp domain-containing protein [Bacillus vallismortis]